MAAVLVIREHLVDCLVPDLFGEVNLILKVLFTFEDFYVVFRDELSLCRLLLFYALFRLLFWLF
jgi:hypothetical protein